MNKVFLIGRLSKEPDLSITEKNVDMVRFSLAVDDNKNTNQTHFFDCISWWSTAKYIGTYCKKGDLVAIDGKLSNYTYLSNDGRKITNTRIIVESIKLILHSRKNSNSFDAINNEQNINMHQNMYQKPNTNFYSNKNEQEYDLIPNLNDKKNINLDNKKHEDNSIDYLANDSHEDLEDDVNLDFLDNL